VRPGHIGRAVAVFLTAALLLAPVHATADEEPSAPLTPTTEPDPASSAAQEEPQEECEYVLEPSTYQSMSAIGRAVNVSLRVTACGVPQWPADGVALFAVDGQPLAQGGVYWTSSNRWTGTRTVETVEGEHTLTTAFVPAGADAPVATASVTFTLRYGVPTIGSFMAGYANDDPSLVTISGTVKRQTFDYGGSGRTLVGTATLSHGSTPLATTSVAEDGRFVFARVPTTAGTPLTVSYAGSADYAPATAQYSFTDRRTPVTISDVVAGGVRNRADLGATIHTSGGSTLFTGAGAALGVHVDGRKVASLPLQDVPHMQTQPNFTQRLQWEGVPLPAGTYPVTLTYLGNAAYAPTSATAQITVARTRTWIDDRVPLVTRTTVIDGVRYGSALQLTARVVEYEDINTPLTGPKVQFQARAQGATSWRTLATVGVRDGYARTSVTQKVNTTYRAVVVSDTQFAPVNSSVSPLVKTRRTLSVSTAPSSTRPTTQTVVSATAGPRGTFVLQRYSSGAWRTVEQKTPVGSADTAATARFTVTRASTATKWRVVVKASSTAMQAVSGTITIPRR
jgi:hypothetical protein